MTYKTDIQKKLLGDIIPTVPIAILIIVCAVWQKQSFLKTLPTLITLFVQILMVRTNRIAFLIGGANTLLYAASYYSEGLCFSAMAEAFVSAPIMVLTYFNWKKSEKDGRASLLLLKNKARVSIILILTALWILCVSLLGNLISAGRFVWLDCLYFVTGLTVTLLSSLRYADAQYLNVFCCCVNLAMWTAVSVHEPRNLNFVIIAIYNLFRVSQMAINWTKLTNRGGERNEN